MEGGRLRGKIILYSRVPMQILMLNAMVSYSFVESVHRLQETIPILQSLLDKFISQYVDIISDNLLNYPRSILFFSKMTSDFRVPYLECEPSRLHLDSPPKFSVRVIPIIFSLVHKPFSFGIHHDTERVA